MAKLKFSTVTTITKGSLVVGEWVEMESVLTTIATGKHHRTVQSAGFYDGQRASEWEPTDGDYHYFKGGHIGATPQSGLHGFPVSNFK